MTRFETVDIYHSPLLKEMRDNAVENEFAANPDLRS